ncbi:MAG: hypothetical protein EXQ56_14095 [Acidobacteria bacterium]|nr:hypothetical protein [Acidobacteriota bacterium]
MIQKRRIGTIATTVAMLALLMVCPAAAQESQTARPVGFADQIKAFLESDRTSPPPQQGILFIGSSIFRQWANLKDQMAPLPVFNRAFGGARTWEVLHYMDQIVLPYRPRIIVYYTGSNDVNAGESAPAIAARIKAFVQRAHAALPGTRVYFVAINKSPDKRARWSVVDAVNAEMLALASTTPHLRYLDLNPVIFDAHGEPRMDLYRPDGLHFHPPAYELFTAIVKPVLIDAWQQLGAPQSGLVPSLTPEQIKMSEALAARYDQSAAREQARLETFKNRPLGAVVQRSFDVNANYLTMAAEMMPEPGYAFRPTPDVRNFGEQLIHAAVSHYSFCNQAGVPSGVARQAAPDLRAGIAKAGIVKALKDSVAYCDRVLAAASEAWLLEIAPKVGGSSSGLVEGMRTHAFMYNNVHDAEDYGTITTYLRMQGLVPPSSALHSSGH